MIEYYRPLGFDPGLSSKIADLHTHTKFSDGEASVPELLDVSILRGLDALAITDHDRVKTSIKAAEEAYKRGLPIQILTGSEITTQEGHLLALGIEDDIPPHLSLLTTIALIHKHGGLAIAPHPFYRRLQGSQLGRKGLLLTLRNYDPQFGLDAVEIRNGGVTSMRGSIANDQAMMFYLQHQDYFGAAIGSSDAHRLDVGSTITAYQGDIFEAIRSGQTAIFYQDRQEGLERINTAVEIIGGRVFESVPRFITRRNTGRNLDIQIFGVKLDTPSKTLADQSLTFQELARFRGLNKDRQSGWIASRLATKMAYCTLTGSELEPMRFISIGHKIFRNKRSGPPYIVGGEDFYYSLSHSGNVGMGAAANVPIGVDVQKIRYDRTSDLKVLKDEEIVAEASDSDLDLAEIIAKIWTIKEAVAKGTQIGLSRQLSLKLTKRPSGEYVVEPYFKGVALPTWLAKTFRKGDYFLTAALINSPKADFDLNWVEL